MSKTVAIIGAGQIGLLASFIFSAGGFKPTVYARSTPPLGYPEPERFHRYIAGENDPPSADVVFDTIAFDALDVERYDPDTVGQLIVVSSASVYCDESGKTLDEAAVNGFPDFPEPITEEQATVAPGPETYSTRKVRMERRALELFGKRAAVLRPCAIHGMWSRHPREWWFVKRLLDGRSRIPLIHSGSSQFQTTDARAIGGLALQIASGGHGGICNVADADAPSVLQIGTYISAWMEKPVEFLPIEGIAPDFVGRTPWSVPKPFVVSTRRQKLISERSQVEPYGHGAPDSVEWLADLNPADWRAAFPQLAAYPWDLFDYEAEDRFLATL